MLLYPKREITRLKINKKAYDAECRKLCLRRIDSRYTDKDLYTLDNLIAHANFTILQTIDALHDNMIDDATASAIYDKIEALIYASDMIGTKRIFEKINNEILDEILKIEVYTNFVVVLCDD